MLFSGLFKKKNKKTDDGASGVEPFIPASEENGRRRVKLVLPAPPESAEPEKDDYYSNGAEIFKVIRIVSTVLLVTLILLVLTAFSDVFTDENLRYLLKNLEINSGELQNSFDNIYFSTNGSFDVVSFNGDIAICSGGELKTIDSRGGISFSDSYPYTDPVLLHSKKYLLMYDRSRNGYSIYNGFSRVHSETIDENIILADLCDSGYYALQTDDSEYVSIIRIYDDNFVNLKNLDGNKNITSLKLSSDGKYIIYASVSLHREELVISEVNAYEVLTGELIFKETIKGETIIKVDFVRESEDILMTALTDRRLYSISEKGIQGSYAIRPSALSYFALDSAMLVYSVKNNVIDDKTEIIFVDTASLEEVYKTRSEDFVRSIRLGFGCVYILTDGKVIRIGKDKNEACSKEGKYKEIVPYSSDNALGITEGKIEFIEFE